jgi:hypothetical protein
MQFDFVKIKLGYFLHKKEMTVTSCVYRYRIQERHGVWNPLPELNIISPYVHSTQSRLQIQHIYQSGNPLCQSRPPYARVGFITQSGTLDLALDVYKYTFQIEHRRQNIIPTSQGRKNYNGKTVGNHHSGKRK